jgi:hypothetical protein
MGRYRLVVLVSLIAALALNGCGGGNGNADQVKASFAPVRA